MSGWLFGKSVCKGLIRLRSQTSNNGHSLQWPVSSVPMVALLKRFICILWIGLGNESIAGWVPQLTLIANSRGEALHTWCVWVKRRNTSRVWVSSFPQFSLRLKLSTRQFKSWEQRRGLGFGCGMEFLVLCLYNSPIKCDGFLQFTISARLFCLWFLNSFLYKTDKTRVTYSYRTDLQNVNYTLHIFMM